MYASPMRYLMKQKVFCLGDDYTVTDESGNERFLIDGKVFTIRDSLSLQDMQGNVLAHIRQRLISLGKTYEIERNGHTTVVHKHLFTLFSARFTVDVPGPSDLEAKGNLTDHEYEFIDASGNAAAVVSKRWFALRDTYGVEIVPGQDDVLILAATVVIDLCCHGDKQGH